jgi:NAD(P)-dependent dehydrogenase (short-subunit alcohol dehydrogenase family)
MLTSRQYSSFVTGSGQGIGRAIVLELIKQGNPPICTVRSKEHREELILLGANPILCDLTQPDAETIVREAVDEFPLSLVVCCAGIGASELGFENLSENEIWEVLNLNLFGTIRTLRGAINSLKRAPLPPTVIVLSSRFGSIEWVVKNQVPNAEATYAYRLSKAAVNMLIACLTSEFKEVKFLAVDPGKVKTRFGPRDADITAETTAKAIIELTKREIASGTFVDRFGNIIPW